MIFIWGFNVRFRGLESLVFFCPQCGGDRQGERKLARRWFTFFFIPLIPLKTLGEVVECGTCRSQFRPEVAQRPTSAALVAALGTATRAITAMLVRMGDPSDPQLRHAAAAHIATAVGGYPPEALDDDVATVDPALAEQYVSPLVGEVTVAGREQFLLDLSRVAGAGAAVSPAQRQLLERVGAGLGLTQHHVAGILGALSASPQALPPVEPPPAG